MTDPIVASPSLPPPRVPPVGETLRQKQSRFANWLAALIAKAIDMGFEVTMGETWRTPEQAIWNAQHGLGTIHSLHIQRLAVDLNLFKDGVLLADNTGYEALGAWWKNQYTDFCYGGDFGIRDYDHYSLTPDGIHK